MCCPICDHRHCRQRADSAHSLLHNCRTPLTMKWLLTYFSTMYSEEIWGVEHCHASCCFFFVFKKVVLMVSLRMHTSSALRANSTFVRFRRFENANFSISLARFQDASNLTRLLTPLLGTSNVVYPALFIHCKYSLLKLRWKTMTTLTITKETIKKEQIQW